MILNRLTIRGALLLAALFVFSAPAFAEPVAVKLEQTDQGWRLIRGGEPYFIRGAGGTGSLAELKAAGANSVRTWGGTTRQFLDQAHAAGLTVAVGLWLGHERHGFDYNNPKQVQEQLERVREEVLRLKDHPAVLLWGVGNEMEGFAEGDNPAIWKAVNDVAAMIKQIDPNHPTMTVTAFVHGDRLKYVHQHCPAVDIHGINAYGKGALAVPERLQQANASKPYVLTEFGPQGAWDATKTSWDAPLELNSTQKAKQYGNIWQQTVVNEPGWALGGYAFTWGHKMEATETWFGMFLADGSRTGAIDAMTEAWTGKPPSNQSPHIEALTINIDGPRKFQPGQQVQFHAKTTDPDGDPLTARWQLKPETDEHVTGGDFRPTPAAMKNAVLKSDVSSSTVQMPEYPGPYRLFYFAYDQAGNAATANIPLLVLGEPRTRLPFVVYEEHLEHMPWLPSGFMGNAKSLTIVGNSLEQPFDGKSAIKVRYDGKFDWAGIAWQNPANNWGEQDGGFDLRGAKRLELWARGEYGGEKVSFGVGLITKDKPFPDSAIAKVDGIVLSHQWQRYSVPLAGRDLSSLKNGFVLGLTGRSTPVTIYLDNIRFIP